MLNAFSNAAASCSPERRCCSPLCSARAPAVSAASPATTVAKGWPAPSPETHPLKGLGEHRQHREGEHADANRTECRNDPLMTGTPVLLRPAPYLLPLPLETGCSRWVMSGWFAEVFEQAIALADNRRGHRRHTRWLRNRLGAGMGSVSPESMSSPNSRSARSPFDGDRGGLVAEDQLGERLDVFQRCPHEGKPPPWPGQRPLVGRRRWIRDWPPTHPARRNGPGSCRCQHWGPTPGFPRASTCSS